MFVKSEHDALLKFISKFNGVDNRTLLIASPLIASKDVQISFVEVLQSVSIRDHPDFVMLNDCKFYEADATVISTMFLHKNVYDSENVLIALGKIRCLLFAHQGYQRALACSLSA